MTRQPSIAGVVLTLNEQADLGRALHSLQWCDEIFVLDSGSTDQTPLVAKQHGATFLVHRQTPPFLITEQRNWILRSGHIRSEWCLFLDADEEICPELSSKIQSIINSSSKYSAYYLAPRYWFFGKWLKYTQGYPNWHPRLLKVGSNYFEGGVWEAFHYTSNIGRVYIPYEHYGFSKGIDNWLERHIRYADEESRLIVNGINKTVKPETEARIPYLKKLTFSIWPLRPPLRFFHVYFFRLGFLDGLQGLLYSSLMFVYEVIILVKVMQKLPASQHPKQVLEDDTPPRNH